MLCLCIYIIYFFHCLNPEFLTCICRWAAATFSGLSIFEPTTICPSEGSKRKVEASGLRQPWSQWIQQLSADWHTASCFWCLRKVAEVFKQPLHQCCLRLPECLLRPDQPFASTCSRSLCLWRCTQLPSRGCTSLLETSASRNSANNAVMLRLRSSQKCLILAS